MGYRASGNLLADRRLAYAAACLADGDGAAAADLFGQALELVPDYPPALVGQGDSLALTGDAAGAAEAYRAALAADPADPLGASLKLARLTGAPPPALPPAAYVAGLFDDYAQRFESALVGSLGYRTPASLAALIDGTGRARFARALDLGCGTGLMGAELKGKVGHLAGVDLSAGMVAEARARGIYDELAVADLLTFLAADTTPVDLVTAADVLVYVGDLAPVLAAVRQRLGPDGLFAFSVEAGADGVELRDSLRYAHAPRHVAALAREAGLAEVARRREVLRRDRGADIIGDLWLLSPV